jgi:hypothetical protein
VDLEIVVEGVPDVNVANEIERHVRRVCKGAARTGQWTVTLSPSETRGQWDLGVRGPSRRHFVSFAEGVDRLPELVAGQLRDCLTDTAATAEITRPARLRQSETRE